jgi:hypothetical protein
MYENISAWECPPGRMTTRSRQGAKGVEGQGRWAARCSELAGVDDVCRGAAAPTISATSPGTYRR